MLKSTTIKNVCRGSLYLLALVIQSCNVDPSVEQGRTVPVANSDTTSKSDSSAVRSFVPDAAQLERVKKYLTVTPILTKCELDKMVAEFDRRVFREKDDHKPLLHSTCKFSLAALRGIIPSTTPEGKQWFLMVHYGLDLNGNLIYGIGFTAVDVDNLTFEYPSTVYVADPLTHNLVAWNGSDTWVNTFGVNYTRPDPGTNVFFKRRKGNSTITPFTRHIDTEYVLFSRIELSQFIEANTPDFGEVMDVVEIASYAHFDDDGIYHHGVSLVPWNKDGSMVRDEPSTSGFYMRAMDLGSPCPENCLELKSPPRSAKVPGC